MSSPSHSRMDSYFTTYLNPTVKPSLLRLIYFTTQKRLSLLEESLDTFGIPSLLLTHKQSLDIYTSSAFNIHCVFVKVFDFPFSYKNSFFHRLMVSLIYYFCKDAIEIEFIRLRDAEYSSITQ